MYECETAPFGDNYEGDGRREIHSGRLLAADASAADPSTPLPCPQLEVLMSGKNARIFQFSGCSDFLLVRLKCFLKPSSELR
jgi:hypothetical protein